MKRDVSKSNQSSNESELYCICKKPFSDSFMIACDSCNEWFHGECIKISEKEAEFIDQYFCDMCMETNANLQITFKEGYFAEPTTKDMTIYSVETSSHCIKKSDTYEAESMVSFKSAKTKKFSNKEGYCYDTPSKDYNYGHTFRSRPLLSVAHNSNPDDDIHTLKFCLTPYTLAYPDHLYCRNHKFFESAAKSSINISIPEPALVIMYSELTSRSTT